MNRVLLLASGAVACATSAASADPFWLYDRSAAGPQTAHGFYIGTDMSGGVQMLPRFKSTFTVHVPGGAGAPATSTLAFDPDIKGAQPGGTIGYVFRDGTFPSFFGEKVRLEFSGQYVTMSGRETATRRENAGGAIVVAGIGGRVIGVAGSIPADIREELRIKRDGFNFKLAVKSQWALGPNLSLQPSVGVFGGQTIDGYTHRLGEQISTGLSSVGSTEERIRTREFGGELGGALNWQVWPGIGVQFGGTVGVVHLRSRLDGADCFTAAGLFSLFTNCGPNLAAVQTSTVTDSRSATGFRGTANAAVNLDARIGILTIGGFFRYDSHVPGVDNPQASAVVAPGTPIAPARVRFSGDFGFGGFVRFVMPLQWSVGY